MKTSGVKSAVKSAVKSPVTSILSVTSLFVFNPVAKASEVVHHGAAFKSVLKTNSRMVRQNKNFDLPWIGPGVPIEKAVPTLIGLRAVRLMQPDELPFAESMVDIAELTLKNALGFL